jgi:predicted RNA binding protein YcfA (HicA-like mRNA interferase family)
VKVKEAISTIESDGWYLVRTRGSHRQYKHPFKSGLVTIAGKPSDDLAIGTARSILKQAQLKNHQLGDIDPETDEIN